MEASTENKRTTAIFESPFIKWVIAALFHCGTSAIATWPLLKYMSMWGTSPDTLYYSYNLAWDWHALTTNPLHLFDANMFYPAPHALAAQEHRLGLLVFWILPWLITHRHFIADAFALYTTYVFSGLALHIFMREWTKDHACAGLAAAWINLNPLRIYNAGAIHLVATGWLALTLLAMDKFLTKGGKRWCALMILSFWFQFMSSYYLAYGTLFAVGGYFLLAHFLRPVKNLKRAWLGMAIGGIALFITLLPFVIPYVKQTSPIGDTMQMLITTSPRFPHDFFLSYPRSWLWASKLGMIEEEQVHYPLWMGLGIPLLSLIGVIAGIRSGRGSQKFQVTALFGGLALLMFTLSLGPYLKIGEHATGLPLPFLLFMKIAPGFDNMSTSSRFIHVFMILCAPLVGIGLMEIIKFITTKNIQRIVPLTAIFAVGALDVYCYPMDAPVIYFREDAREVTKWLAGQKIEGGIIEMPFGSEWNLDDTLYLVQSLHHFHPLANGYGSFRPRSYGIVSDLVPRLPDEDALLDLAAIGIKTYVLHTDILDFMRLADGHGPVDDKLAIKYFPELEGYLGVDENTLSAFAGSPHLVEAARFPKDVVYRYVEPYPFTTELTGAVTKLVPQPGRKVQLELTFIGAGGAAWKNPRLIEQAGLVVELIPLEAGLQKLGPFDFNLPLPLAVKPGQPLVINITIDYPAVAGVYTLQITSDNKSIAFPPVNINFQPPPE